MAGNIFINYRRDESGHVAGRLHDSLAPTFGRNKLFMDVDNIPVGRDFEDYLKSQVAACDAMLAVIGPNWLTAKDETGKRRLDNPDDFIVIEIGAALARNIPVVPVLVDGARMPKASELPDSLKPLARRQAIEVRHTNFSRDAEALVKRLREAIGYDSSQRQWRVRAIKASAALAVLSLIGWAGYSVVHPTRIYLEDAYRAVQQLVEETKTERDRQAKAAAEAEEQRKADEAERQRLAKAEEERQARIAAEGERQRKAKEADQARAAEAANREAAEAERQRLAKAEQDRQARAAAEAEQKRKAEQVEQQRQLFTIQMGIEASNASAASDMFYGQSFEECQQKCTREPTCNVFTHNKRSGRCYLYSSAASLRPNADFDSGVRNNNNSALPTLQPGLVSTNPSRPAPVDSSVTKAPSSLFTIQMGIEASNASAASDMFYGQSFEECQQKCTREPTCNVFTHNKRSGRCYLYSSAASLRPNADFDSGVRK